VSGRLKLRRGVIVGEDPLTVEVDGERRPAWADAALLGEMRSGDEVVVNVIARDLGLGSGGFDVVHVNLTRGLATNPTGNEHVIKLNYTSLQHPIAPVELPVRFLLPREAKSAPEGTGRSMPVLVLPLHGHLVPAAWATAQAKKGLKLGYIQTAGGALPGSLSRDVAQLRDRDLLHGHITAARITELAGVSSRTFYQHFEDLWACLLAAYETEAGRLCAEIETACAVASRRDDPRESAATTDRDAAIHTRDRRVRVRAGIAAALDFLAAAPDAARLLSAEPPPQIAPLAGARRDLIERLGTMLRIVLTDPDGATPLPGLERRLVGAALALVATRDPQRLRELEPELSDLLLASL